MAEIIPFRSKEEQKKNQTEEARQFFIEHEKFLREAEEYHDGKDSNQFEHFDPAQQSTGYELTPDVLKTLEEEIKIARKNSMNNIESNFINSDITSDEWDWLKDWLKKEKK